MINELRLGNYVKDGATIIQLGRDELYLAIFDKLALSPIPLTPKILEKCGFDNAIENMPPNADFLTFFKDNMSVELIPDKLGLTYTYEVVLYEDAVDEEGEYCAKGAYTLEYDSLSLHQLQNLFYCLFNQELTITL